MVKILIAAALFLCACTPDPVTMRARKEQTIGRQIVAHPEKRDSLKMELDKIWEF